MRTEEQESHGEEEYRKGMVNEAMHMVRARAELFTDDELGTLISYCEVVLRERQEEVVAAYSHDLPF